MKTPVQTFTVVVLFLMLAHNVQAQCSKTDKLPINALFNGSVIDGITVTATTISTGNNVDYGPDMGKGGTSTNMGGTSFTAPAGYTTSDFTVIDENSTKIVGNNISTAKSIGFKITFSTAVSLADIITVDIDGIVNNNAEWITAFGYNSDGFVKYKGTGGSNVVMATGLDANTSWNNLKPGLSAQDVQVWRSDLTSGSPDPTDNRNWVTFNPDNSSDKVTEFYVLWGIRDNVSAPSNQTAGIGPLNITYDPCTLPLKLTSFTGTSVNNSVVLNWQTESEVNTRKFEIEYSSNGKNYASIGTVSANGSGANTYSYKDVNVLNSMNYYRLKMIDNDGTFTYSNTYTIVKKELSGNQLELLSAFPTSFSSQLTVQYSAGSDRNVVVRMYDMSGKLVEQTKKQLLKGTGQFILSDLDKLAKGLYTLQVQDQNGNIRVKKVLK